MTLGDKIRKFRQDRHWTQDELAEKIGIHGRHLSRYENNRARPRRKVLKRLAEVFGVPSEEFLSENGKEKLVSLIPDPELLEQFQEVVTLEEEDQRAIKRLIAAMITKKWTEEPLEAIPFT